MGHFGRELPEFTWEKTDRADALRAACGLALAALFRDSLSIPRGPPSRLRRIGKAAVLLKAAIRVVRPRCFRYT